VLQMGTAGTTAFTAQCMSVLDSGVIEKLREKLFDVYIIETFDPCGMMLAHHIKPRSVILQSTTFLWQQQLDEVGISRELSYNPMRSLLTTGSLEEEFREPNGRVCRSIEALFKHRFGPDFPSLREQTSRVTWVFTNSDPLYDFTVPTLYKVIPVPGRSSLHPRILIQNWKGILAKREKAVIISFGTLAKLNNMSPAFKLSFQKMFTSFPHITFIIKYDDLEDEIAVKELSKVENLHLTKWMPQNDLLHDPHVVLFITHCGMGSVQELTLSGKPGLFIPLFGDQMRNALMLEHAGNELHLDKADVGVSEKFIAAVKDALENEKYKIRAMEIKVMLNGKPYSAKELLLKHVDFDAKYGPTAVMRPRSHDMTWIEYQNADVWLFIVSSIVLIALLAIYILISLV
ncbi:hypothetical protein PENTCL1PPCAC_12044, partial [Pristionchus entomophagus]